ncbi:putative E3 ubiquitin-protein ligase MARCH10 [Bienertia sinuspersici]
MNHETIIELKATEKQNLGCSVDARVLETVIGIPEDSQFLSNSEESDIVRDSDNRSNNAEEGYSTGFVTEKKVLGIKDEKNSFIDAKNEDEEIGDGEKVCRICHLNSEQPWKLEFFGARTDLIQLGCGCKGELSIGHSYCAEAWFKLKGNRICEICGETADNVRGVGNESFMEEWKDSRVNSNTTDASDRSTEGCWHGQPLCNFLMACLVIAFVLPWFFRINMF